MYVLNKTSFFCLKTEDKNIDQVLSGGWYQWEGEDTRKRCKRVNMVEILVLSYENGTMRSVETIPEMGVGR
jgi:hypothetical protein